MSDKRPPGGSCFEAVQLLPEGWVVLSPWIQTPDGYWWRPQFNCSCWKQDAEQWSKHMAEEINKAMDADLEDLQARVRSWSVRSGMPNEEEE